MVTYLRLLFVSLKIVTVKFKISNMNFSSFPSSVFLLFNQSIGLIFRVALVAMPLLGHADGNPAPPKGAQPQIFGPCPYCGQTVAHLSYW